jgi:hypothetical protein
LLGFFTQPRACFGGAWLPGWAVVGRFQGGGPRGGQPAWAGAPGLRTVLDSCAP